MSTQDALFGGFDPPAAEEPLSADRRRTQQQHALVDAGVHPLTRTKTRPELGTCGDCALRVGTGHHGRTFPKCTLGAQLEKPPFRAGPYMTHGAATDCRAWWPACDNFQPRSTS